MNLDPFQKQVLEMLAHIVHELTFRQRARSAFMLALLSSGITLFIAILIVIIAWIVEKFILR